MIERGAGSILIVGSTVTRAPSYWGAAYRASKAALKSYTETLAIELAPYGIKVNMLTPGALATPLVADMSPVQRRNVEAAIPLWHREGRPEQIAPSAVFLLSDRLSASTTRADLVVDAGLTLRPFPVGDDDTIRDLNATTTPGTDG